MTLQQIEKGKEGKIESITLPIDLFNRLASMGIVEGSVIKVIDNCEKRPILVELSGKQFAISYKIASQIILAV